MRNKIINHALLLIVFLVSFILLNRPEVIVLSHLGSVVWYPATGLMVAMYLGLSPAYGIVGVLAIFLAGNLIYKQLLSTASQTIGAVCISAFYAFAAYLLRHRMKINLSLGRRRDVTKYLLVTTAAALASTAIGVLCLVYDDAIEYKEFWRSSLQWFLGDEIGILGVAPFLLIYVFPWVRAQMDRNAFTSQLYRPDPRPNAVWHWLEAGAQAATGAAILVIIFVTGADELLYLVFIPVIWAASRQGIRRVTSSLLLLNFGIVVASHSFPLRQDLSSGIGLLMFVVSGLGMLIGSLVSERYHLASELLDTNSQLAAAKNRAEEASRIKGEFLANMSHEIRTPVNGMLGMTELLINTNLTAEQREYTGMLKTSGVSLLSVIHDILDFSKMEKGKLTLEAIPFRLSHSISEVMRIMALKSHEKGLELAYEVESAVPEILVGDPGRLRQILMNLVGNAIKFTAQGEVVLVVRQEIRIDQQMVLHFTIRDTGIGIAKEKHALIFDAFAQADGSTTRHYGGTGLGLAISSQIVELMEGRIWVSSETGRGSTFHFTAKFGLLPASTDTTPTLGLEDLREIRVLVVDDNATNREILRQITKDLGMRPTTVQTGEEALRTLRQAEENDCFRLVIIDGRMPRMDGFEIVERIRRNSRLCQTIIMMLSCSDKNGEIERCQQLGIQSYLVKPISKPELLIAARNLLFPRSEARRSFQSNGTSLQKTDTPLHILVAEDNLVNQKVIVSMLEKLGHCVSVAQDGRVALSMLSAELFDLVFMDIQMPDIDGLTATRKIREQESRTGSHVPIVAMTAHAMTGDRERCLKSGMDDYLSKPISSLALCQVIAKLMPVSCDMSRAAHRPMNSRPVQTGSGWNIHNALARLDGDESLLNDLIEIFLKEYPQQLAKLHDGIVATNAEIVRITAHTLKGELGYLGLLAAEEQARSLEVMGAQGRLDSALALFSKFESNLIASATQITTTSRVTGREVTDGHHYSPQEV